jgi:ubiquitin carboxyl-terminal hydrolase 8
MSANGYVGQGFLKHNIETRVSLDMPPSHSSGRSTPTDFPDAPKTRPAVRPKPENLHGRLVLSNGALTNGVSRGADALTERFARLRTSAIQAETGSGYSSQRSSQDYAAVMPSPSDYRPNSHSSSRPMGPRSMPVSAGGPPHPPKLPLETEFSVSMPKPPSPTYSPARNMSIPGNINPPRSTARSIVGTGGRSNSIASSTSTLLTNSQDDSEFSNTAAPISRVSTAGGRRSSILPSELQIEAPKLFDYMKMYNVLLIDVRNREDFDEGHIFARSILCIEPTSLRDGMSAEQLLDSLILSPDEEPQFFEDRDQYDLVVYYDQNTKDISYLNRAPQNQNEAALRHLFTALQDFNQEKPLKRSPILLKGGLDAWISILGQTSLKVSKTASAIRNSKSARPATRTNRAPSLNLQKKRRDYNPLDKEEVQTWLERARSERAAVEQRPMIDEEEEDYNGEGETSFYRTTDDFLRRYPDPASIEQQSMMYPPKRSELPEPPARPAPSLPSIPSVPIRPPPAVPRVSYSGVHDRDSGPTTTVTRTAQPPIYIPSATHPRNMLPKTGLINFGVTCYMNSTIQCLNATLPLTRIFLSNQYLRLLQRENWKGSGGLMAEHYATLIQNIWAQDVRALRPSSLRKLSARFNSEWGIDRQQDAKEYLEFLIDILHEDMNSRWMQPPLKALTTADEAYRETLPKPYVAYVEWLRYCHRDKSYISDLFAGQHASRLRCTVCKRTSTTYEAFYSISVEIPHDRPADIRDCLRSYCSEEMLDKDDVWKCPFCKQEREATKQITITRAPLYLVIHLKRFSASHVERARKVRTPIEFPLTGLDIGPFMLTPTTATEDSVIMKQNEGAKHLKDMKSDCAMNGPYKYNAYGVIRHIGQTLQSGHYISMVKDSSRGCWRQFNDDKVSDFDPDGLRTGDRLQNEQAYIIFYERVSPH